MKRIISLSIAVFTVLAASRAHAERGISPQLVGGPLAPSETQEQFGLLTLNNPEGSCSASMLNSYWAITAAHCVYSKGGVAMFLPSQISLSANWPSNKKTVKALQVVAYSNGTSAPLDIALLQTGLYDFARPDFSERKLEPQRPATNSTVTAYGRGIFALATGSGPSATPTQSDGQFRTAQFSIFGIPDGGTTYSVSGTNGSAIAGGDSGGPDYIQDYDDPLSINRKLEFRLLGVHSHGKTTCLPGQDCSTNPWTWVSAVTSSTNAAVYPLQDSIRQTIQQIPATQQFIGTFGKTPPGYQPIWMYVVAEDGMMRWYRTDSKGSAWQGPAIVGTGWQDLLDVIPAGGNRFYGIASDGTLLWYQHTGFNNGQFDWLGPATVGSGWNGFRKVFSGGDGVLYAITQDGTLLWYRNNGYQTGAAYWEGPKIVGTGWDSFKDVFSMGEGIVYGVQQDGTLLWYKHTGIATGDFSWEGPFPVGDGWDQFSKIIPAGGGVILAIKPDGTLLWYKHDNYQSGFYSYFAGLWLPMGPVWEGAVEIGSGWTGYRQVTALLPQTIIQGPN